MNVVAIPPVAPVVELRRQWADFCFAQNPTHALTLAYNGPASHTKIRADLCHLHARLDRKLLGRRFNVLPGEGRTWFAAFGEHLTTNAHAHLVVRVPPDRCAEFERLFPTGTGRCDLWTRLAPAGTYAAEPLSDPAGWARYSIKDLTEDSVWMLSGEFLPNRAAA